MYIIFLLFIKVFYITFGISVVFGAISEAAMIFFQHLEDKAEEERKKKEKEMLLSEGKQEVAIPENDDDIYRHERMKIMFYTSFVVAVMIIGGTTVSMIENMTFISGFYWAFQTTTTVGTTVMRIVS
jgi:predicted anti-sigma-YlaC factor YlaD